MLKTMFRAAAALGMAALFGCASPSLQVAEMGSFHVGGRAVTLSGLPPKELVFTPGAPPLKLDPNGDFEVEALYARYTRLANPKARYPLLLWHGGGLAGTTFETKPDGERVSTRRSAGYFVLMVDFIKGKALAATYGNSRVEARRSTRRSRM